ncbi:hypothetical protein J4E80_002769 [Alternaria sp. BMP 0032]|nr:hypothetical protein J4E80_002769 [Alternaria sp. BMP 0032]
MATEWARKWLSDPSSTPASNQQITIIDELLSSKTSPKTCASATASLVEAQDDISFALADLVGVYYSAAESCTSLEELELLVAYLVELARQPDAVNRGPEARSWDVPGLEPPPKIGVGEVIVIEGKRLWSQLPGFSMHLTEKFQGPELWTHSIRNPATPEVATTKWKDFNTLLALTAHDPDAQITPALADYTRLSRVTLAMALEYSPNTRLGKNTAMHVPAAAQWLLIAGKEIEEMCEAGTESMNGGDLWVERGGSDVCDVARLQFWKERLRDLGY